MGELRVRGRRRLLTALVLLSALPCLAGCGSNRVTGKVYYKDKIVPGGMVVFHGDGWTRNSPIEEDGSYTIDKPTTGKVKITVDTSSYKPVQLPANANRPDPSQMAKMAKMPGAPKDMKPPEMPDQAKDNPLYGGQSGSNRYVQIPERYADEKQTTLTYEVKSGKQTHDIKMD
jgi:hypothetical protein